MKLKLHIHDIKSINDLSIELPVERGLYAITGQNGTGKSTIATCASRAFFNMRMDYYFGDTSDEALIECELNGIKRTWRKQNGIWRHSSNGRMEIKGFYEGSLIFGNRFRNTSFENLKKAAAVKDKKLIPADDFVRSNLGEILHGDRDFYEKMWYVPGDQIGLNGGFVYYYEKSGRRVSQFHMSTGENLLVSILNSINIRNNDREDIEKPCMFFLDEIELALHPSSLKRLVLFLNETSKIYNYAVYFSTHSIELISGIAPKNIFYIERFSDNSIQIINPCFPAYATKFLYDQSGYDKVILVEDDLAKEIVDRIIRKEQLLNSKLVHILPCGGWTNVLNLADDSLRNYLLGKRTSLAVILDRDVKTRAEKFVIDHSLAKCATNYLPIESLEKYLRSRLVLNVDHKLYRLLCDYVFQQTALQDIIHAYQTDPQYNYVKDNNGKTLYALIEQELQKRKKDRREIIEIVLDHLFKENGDEIVEVTNFLKAQLGDD